MLAVARVLGNEGPPSRAPAPRLRRRLLRPYPGGLQGAPASELTWPRRTPPAAGTSIVPKAIGRAKRRGPIEPGLKIATPRSTPMKGTCIAESAITLKEDLAITQKLRQAIIALGDTPNRTP